MTPAPSSREPILQEARLLLSQVRTAKVDLVGRVHAELTRAEEKVLWIVNHESLEEGEREPWEEIAGKIRAQLLDLEAKSAKKAAKRAGKP
jgi:hypothetical protein